MSAMASGTPDSEGGTWKWPVSSHHLQDQYPQVVAPHEAPVPTHTLNTSPAYSKVVSPTAYATTTPTSYAVPARSVDEKEAVPLTSEWKEKRVLGLSVPAFWIIIAVIVLIIAGALAGGVAGGLMAQRAPTECSISTCGTATQGSSQSTPASSRTLATTTVTVTAGTATTGPSAVAANPGCPAADGNKIRALDAAGSEFGDTFTIMCGTNYPGGAQYGNPTTFDLMKLYAPNLAACVAACAYYNQKYDEEVKLHIAAPSGRCTNVALVLKEGEYCYLKNATGTSSTHGEDSKLYVTALLG